MAVLVVPSLQIAPTRTRWALAAAVSGATRARNMLTVKMLIEEIRFSLFMELYRVFDKTLINGQVYFLPNCPAIGLTSRLTAFTAPSR